MQHGRMTKDELIAQIRLRLAGEARTRGEKAFLGYFVEYLRRLDLKHWERYGFRSLIDYLPQIIGDAFELLRTGNEEWVTSYRREFRIDTEQEVPCLQQVGVTNLIYRSLVVNHLSFLFKELLNYEGIRFDIDAYFNAETRTLQLYFDKFIRDVYRNGLFTIITGQSGGFKGVFGNTELRCHALAGRVMFTFTRTDGSDEDVANVSFVAEDEDDTGYSAGLQSVNTTLVEGVTMITEVINVWPTNKDEQELMFKKSPDVCFNT